MGSITETARSVLADGPSTSPQPVSKAEMRALMALVDNTIASVVAGYVASGGLVYSTKALLDADLAHAAHSGAWVVADSTPANNGIYEKNLGSGSGSWIWRAPLPAGADGLDGNDGLPGVDGQDGADGEDGRDGADDLDQRGRPGDAPLHYTLAPVDGPAERSAPVEHVSGNQDGATVRLTGEARVASRTLFSIEAGRKYRARFVVRRHLDSADPSGDAIEHRILWYNWAKVQLVGDDAFTVAAEIEELAVDDGLSTTQKTLARTGVGGVDVTAPALARYFRVETMTHGGSHTTDVEVLDAMDVTELTLWSPSTAAWESRLAALEAENPATVLPAVLSHIGISTLTPADIQADFEEALASGSHVKYADPLETGGVDLVGTLPLAKGTDFEIVGGAVINLLIDDIFHRGFVLAAHSKIRGGKILHTIDGADFPSQWTAFNGTARKTPRHGIYGNAICAGTYSGASEDIGNWTIQDVEIVTDVLNGCPPWNSIAVTGDVHDYQLINNRVSGDVLIGMLAHWAFDPNTGLSHHPRRGIYTGNHMMGGVATTSYASVYLSGCHDMTVELCHAETASRGFVIAAGDRGDETAAPESVGKMMTNLHLKGLSAHNIRNTALWITGRATKVPALSKRWLGSNHNATVKVDGFENVLGPNSYGGSPIFFEFLDDVSVKNIKYSNAAVDNAVKTMIKPALLVRACNNLDVEGKMQVPVGPVISGGRKIVVDLDMECADPTFAKTAYRGVTLAGKVVQATVTDNVAAGATSIRLNALTADIYRGMLFAPTGTGTLFEFDEAAMFAGTKTAALMILDDALVLSGEQTIQSVLTSATRVVVNKSVSKHLNGIYVTGAGAWTRATDFDQPGEMPITNIRITAGDYANTTWDCITVAPVVVGVTEIEFEETDAENANVDVDHTLKIKPAPEAITGGATIYLYTGPRQTEIKGSYRDFYTPIRFDSFGEDGVTLDNRAVGEVKVNGVKLDRSGMGHITGTAREVVIEGCGVNGSNELLPDAGADLRNQDPLQTPWILRHNRFNRIRPAKAYFNIHGASIESDNIFNFYAGGGLGASKLDATTGWGPASLTSAAWWDPTYAASYVDDGGGLISSWADRLLGVTLTATTTARPTRGATALNGYPGITGNGTANALVSTSFGALPVGSTAGVIAAAYSEPNGRTTTEHLLQMGSAAASGDRTLAIVGAVNRRWRASDRTVNIDDGATDATGPNIIAGIWIGTTMYLRGNGAPAGSPSTQATIATLSTGTTRMRLFANNASSAGNFSASTLGDIIMAPAATFDALKAAALRLEGWMAWRYGIVSKLPASHPFKLWAP